MQGLDGDSNEAPQRQQQQLSVVLQSVPDTMLSSMSAVLACGSEIIASSVAASEVQQGKNQNAINSSVVYNDSFSASGIVSGQNANNSSSYNEEEDVIDAGSGGRDDMRKNVPSVNVGQQKSAGNQPSVTENDRNAASSPFVAAPGINIEPSSSSSSLRSYCRAGMHGQQQQHHDRSTSRSRSNSPTAMAMSVPAGPAGASISKQPSYIASIGEEDGGDSTNASSIAAWHPNVKFDLASLGSSSSNVAQQHHLYDRQHVTTHGPRGGRSSTTLAVVSAGSGAGNTNSDGGGENNNINHQGTTGGSGGIEAEASVFSVLSDPFGPNFSSTSIIGLPTSAPHPLYRLGKFLLLGMFVITINSCI